MNPTYPIRAVSKMTGIHVETLRAWERRYCAVQPIRQGGRRNYSEAEVQRLKLLKQAVDGGMNISQLANLRLEELKSLLDSKTKIKAAPGKAGHLGAKVEKLLELFTHYQVVEAEKALTNMATFMPPRDFVHDISAPLLQRVGEQWAEGHVGISHEHLISAALRNVLGTMIRLHGNSDPRGSWIFTTPPQELHEFGILMAAMLALAHAKPVLYLGPQMPAEDLAEVAKSLEAEAVVLGSLKSEWPEHLTRYFYQLHEVLKQDTQIYIGGKVPPIQANKLQKMKGMHCLQNLNDLEEAFGH